MAHSSFASIVPVSFALISSVNCKAGHTASIAQFCNLVRHSYGRADFSTAIQNCCAVFEGGSLSMKTFMVAAAGIPGFARHLRTVRLASLSRVQGLGFRAKM